MMVLFVKFIDLLSIVECIECIQVTMKKLAMIQDPELYGSVAGDKQQQIAAEGGRQSVGIRQQQLNGRASALMKDLNDSAIAMGNGINGNGKWHQERRNNASTPVSSVSGGGVWREQQQLPTAEDSNNNNNCNGNDNAHVLDSVWHFNIIYIHQISD
jgi:hypothetical protein